jgi:hypothetical protein
MKKLMLMLAIIGTAVSAFAQTPSSDPVKEIQKSISESVKFPQSMKSPDFEESVDATIKVLPGGDIEVLEIETENKDLSEYLSGQLKSIILPGDLLTRALTLSMSFTFKVL